MQQGEAVYFNKEYITQERLLAYLEQFKYIDENDRVLEIGAGPGIFKSIANRICQCLTIDTDPKLNPDFVIDIRNSNELISLKDKFDKIFCCQVLEHMKFEEAKVAFHNILSLNAKVVCISIPDNRKAIRVKAQLQGFCWQKVISIPFSGRKVSFNNNRIHHWEMYSKNKNNVFDLFKKVGHLGYRLDIDYRLYARPIQHFFIYKRKDK